MLRLSSTSTIPRAAPCAASRKRRAASAASSKAAKAVTPRASIADDDNDDDYESSTSRRSLLSGIAASALAASLFSPASPPSALAASLGAAAVEDKVLCDAECEALLKDAQLVELPSGLSYKDVRVGSGPEPPVGFQVVANYVAMTPNGKVFDSSLNRGAPYDFRIGSGQIVPGLDEGIKTMKAGGLRRVYVPGSLSFPKGLPSGPGRPRVPPASPVVFDVELLYIPGLDDE